MVIFCTRELNIREPSSKVETGLLYTFMSDRDLNSVHLFSSNYRFNSTFNSTSWQIGFYDRQEKCNKLIKSKKQVFKNAFSVKRLTLLYLLVFSWTFIFTALHNGQ